MANQTSVMLLDVRGWLENANSATLLCGLKFNGTLEMCGPRERQYLKMLEAEPKAWLSNCRARSVSWNLAWTLVTKLLECSKKRLTGHNIFSFSLSLLIL